MPSDSLTTHRGGSGQGTEAIKANAPLLAPPHACRSRQKHHHETQRNRVMPSPPVHGRDSCHRLREGTPQHAAAAQLGWLAWFPNLPCHQLDRSVHLLLTAGTLVNRLRGGTPQHAAAHRGWGGSLAVMSSARVVETSRRPCKVFIGARQTVLSVCRHLDCRSIPS